MAIDIYWEAGPAWEVEVRPQERKKQPSRSIRRIVNIIAGLHLDTVMYPAQLDLCISFCALDVHSKVKFGGCSNLNCHRLRRISQIRGFRRVHSVRQLPAIGIMYKSKCATQTTPVSFSDSA